MKSIKKILCLAMACTMMASCFVGCGESNGTGSDDSNGSSTSAGAIKIGGIGPTTGAAAIYGSAVKNAAELAVEEVNKLDP